MFFSAIHHQRDLRTENLLVVQRFQELLQEQLEKLACFMTDRSKAIEILESTDTTQLDADGEAFYQECK